MGSEVNGHSEEMLYSETCLCFPFAALVQNVSMRYSVYHILLTTIDTRLTIKEMFQNKEQKNLQNFDFLLYMVLFIILCSVSEPSSDTLLLYISNEKYALFMLYFM